MNCKWCGVNISEALISSMFAKSSPEEKSSILLSVRKNAQCHNCKILYDRIEGDPHLASLMLAEIELKDSR